MTFGIIGKRISAFFSGLVHASMCSANRIETAIRKPR